MRAGFFILAFIVGSLGVYRASDRFFSGFLRVTFFDVGQGDSVLLRFPRGSAWLIDGGGGWKGWNRGQRDLPLELARMGIGSLDAVLLSHPDADHGLGLLGVLEALPVREIAWNASFEPEKHPLLAELKDLAYRRGVLTRAIAGEKAVELEGVELRLVPVSAGGSTNNRPLVLWAEFGGCRFLFAGDAERAAEDQLANAEKGGVDVLKVSHHGSRTSSSARFIAWAKPRWAVASVGRANSYGHPARSVGQRFVSSAARWLRTDVNGFVEFSVSAEGRIACRTAEGGCGEEDCRPSR